MDRREFVRLVGLASGASLLGSCGLDRETEKLIPYLVPPDDGVIPGKAVHYRTTCAECPAGCGVTARVVDHRVVKLEGIESHPVNDGGLCMRGQASICRVYHPDRLRVPLRKDASGVFREVSWEEAYGEVANALKRGRSDGSTREHAFLSSATTGTLSDLIGDFCSQTGVERLPEFEFFSYAAIRESNRILFGLPEIPSYRIDKTDWMLTLGADVLETMTSPVAHAARLARARKGSGFTWIHVEPHCSLSGVRADRRLSIAPGGEVYLLVYLLREASRANLTGERRISELVELLPKLSSRATAEKTGLSADEVERIAMELVSARNPLVVAGGVSTMQRTGLDVALFTGLLQWSAGMIGRTVVFDASAAHANVGSFRDIEAISDRLGRDEIGVMILCAVDPVGAFGQAVGGVGQAGATPVAFAKDLERATIRVGLGEFVNPTLEACDIVLPLSHSLESWGDARPSDGVHGIIQPAIVPVYDTASVGDILLAMVRLYRGASSSLTYEEFLVGRLRERYGIEGVEEMLAEGYLRRPSDGRAVQLDAEAAHSHLRSVAFSEPTVDPVLVVAPSIRGFDGRGRQIALLDEIPDPLTTVTYGGWVSVSQAAAGGMRVRDRDEVSVSGAGWALQLPVKVQPGLQKAVMAVQYSPKLALPVAVDQRSGEMIAVHEGVTVRKTGRRLPLAILSGSLSQQGRGVIGGGVRDAESAHGGHGEKEDHVGQSGHKSFFPTHAHQDYRWGMTIDLDLCIGCSACVAACYVENNVPVVGSERHIEGREMSWLRVEPFYDEGGNVELQPMLCQHCDNAPCETVCPVFATYHNPEGLNAQVYNRCVGTRYCANNCPYKVRRFNWFDFKRPTAANPTQNIEVSARGRGVMEKCSFCVQRIRAAREKARGEGRKIQDGEVVPACAQTCPTNAILFGNLDDEASHVSRSVRSGRAYRVFEHLGTRPAVYYLASKRKRDRV